MLLLALDVGWAFPCADLVTGIGAGPGCSVRITGATKGSRRLRTRKGPKERKREEGRERPVRSGRSFFRVFALSVPFAFSVCGAEEGAPLTEPCTRAPSANSPE